MAFGLSHHTEPVTLGTFHGQTLTATVERYEVRLGVLGVHAQWCALRPRAVEAVSAAGVRRADLRPGAVPAALDGMRRALASLGR